MMLWVEKLSALRRMVNRNTPPIRDFPETERPTKEQSVLQRTFQAGIKRSERVTANLLITLKEDGIELGCNIHNELGNREDANKVAVAAAEQFFGDRAETAALAHHFFGTSIDHDSGNS
jgi:hypothetical protein